MMPPAAGGSSSRPNILTFLIDDMDLERVPFYPRLDTGAAEQLRMHLRSGGCRTGANCTYSAPRIESVGAQGARFLGAHVPVSVCTPSRYSVLTGRLPSSSPFYSGTKMGHANPQVDISWNSWVEQGANGLPCCGPGIDQPCRGGGMGCARKAKTLGSMLQAARYFTGFVGKWHLSPMPYELVRFHSGEHGRLDASDEATSTPLQAAFEVARAEHLEPLVRRTGFNYSGAVSVGNVVELQPLGVGVHNMDWEAEAALRFLDVAHAHVAAQRADGYFLHVCTTLTHSPGPNNGVCADPRLSAGGLLPSSPVGLPTRASVLARTGGQRCGFQEYDASHTLWVDDAVGALLDKLRSLGDEENTLFIVLADHQRVGKGTLYHGIRTPMVLQWPARIPAGQTWPASALVSSLDLVPTALDAAGLLTPIASDIRGEPAASGALPLNAGARLDGLSLLPLLTGRDATAGAAASMASADHVIGHVPSWWRSSIWAELGVAGTVKHRSGWQLVALHFPDGLMLTTPGGTKGTASDLVACEHERLRTGATWDTYTHTRHCVWRDTNASLTTNLIGEKRVRFESDERYQNYHEVEQLLHTPTDLSMQHDLKMRCPRQLLCLQQLVRTYASARVHFDGDASPFGEYTADAASWSVYATGTCDEAVLSLPPERCNDGLDPERSALSCDELRVHHAPTAEEAAIERAEEDEWQLEPHTRQPCTLSNQDCLVSGCCEHAGEQCFLTILGTAHCKPSCHPTDTWSCGIHTVASPPPFRPPSPPSSSSSALEDALASDRRPWQASSSGGVCSDSLSAAAASSESVEAVADSPTSCSGRRLHRDARRFCRRQGARICTVAELRADAAKGSGCSLDGTRVWTNDFCGSGDDFFWALGGSSDAGIPEQCLHWETALPVSANPSQLRAALTIHSAHPHCCSPTFAASVLSRRCGAVLMITRLPRLPRIPFSPRNRPRPRRRPLRTRCRHRLLHVLHATTKIAFIAAAASCQRIDASRGMPTYSTHNVGRRVRTTKCGRAWSYHGLSPPRAHFRLRQRHHGLRLHHRRRCHHRIHHHQLHHLLETQHLVHPRSHRLEASPRTWPSEQ